MAKLPGPAFAALLLMALAAPAWAEGPAQTMDKLLDELTERQNEPLAAVLAEIRAECEQDDEPEACRITALRPYLLPPPAEPAE